MAGTKPVLATRGEVFELRRVLDEAVRRLQDEASRLDSICHHADATGVLGRVCRLSHVLALNLEGMLETRTEKPQHLCAVSGCEWEATFCGSHSS